MTFTVKPRLIDRMLDQLSREEGLSIVKASEANFQREYLGEFGNMPQDWLHAFQGFNHALYERESDCAYCPLNMQCLRGAPLLTALERGHFLAETVTVPVGEKPHFYTHICKRCWCVAFRWPRKHMVHVCTLLREGVFQRHITGELARYRVIAALFGETAAYSVRDSMIGLDRDIIGSCASATRTYDPLNRNKNPIYDPPHPYSDGSERRVHPRNLKNCFDCRQTIRSQVGHVICPKTLHGK